jgi:Tfp pilus assembly protein PilN
MIQFNLLPDVKMQYVKAKRTKRLIISTATLVSIGSIVIVGILFSVVQFGQKTHIKGLTEDIKSETAKIQATEGINELLTVQNQLTLLPGLHENRPETSRLFDYVTFMSPNGIQVLSLSFDAGSSSIVIQGSADKISTVNKFVDNIKAITYKTQDNSEALGAPAFSQVATQLSGDNLEASFRIQLVFDPVIFSNTQEIEMKLDSQTFSTKNTENQ